MKKYYARISGTYWMDVEITARDEQFAHDTAKWKAEEHFENFNLRDDPSVEYDFTMDKIKLTTNEE